MFHLRKLQRLKILNKLKCNVRIYSNINVFNILNNSNISNQHPLLSPIIVRSYATPETIENEPIDPNLFEKVCEETLESLTEYFEELVESAPHLKEADVSYSSGVLTISFGEPYGTYVINKQTPNRQIWLSSPKSGPKRYDFMTQKNCWVYKHSGETMHGLLQEEIGIIVNGNVAFEGLSYSKLK